MATQPKLAMIPSGYKDDSPNGTLYSALPTDGAGDFDVTRGSDATRINKDGLIEAVTGNTPRLDYTGGGCPSLLLEPSSTNLITQSEAFGNSYWIKSGASVVGGFASPSASSPLGAFKLTEDSNNGNHYIVKQNAFTTNGNNHTWSLYAKRAENRYIALTNRQGAGIDGIVIFDLQDGGFSSTPTTVIDSWFSEELSNGWFKISFVSKTNGSPYDNFVISLSKDGNSDSYQGDGTSGVYLFGAQLEQKSYATSYIPTSGSAQTRLADTANGAGDSSTFNDSEGVLMVGISALEDTSYIALGSNSNNRVVLGASVGNLRSYNNIGGTVIDFTSSIIASNNNKLAIKYKSGNTDFYINGFKVFESSTVFSASTPFNEIIFGNLAGGTQNFYGKTKQIQYYNTALTDSELETLTSYTSFNAMALAQNYTI